jgi:hypothetical protein
MLKNSPNVRICKLKEYGEHMEEHVVRVGTSVLQKEKRN